MNNSESKPTPMPCICGRGISLFDLVKQEGLA